MIELMKFEEKVLFSLRQLYQSYGYQQFKMSKFEPYDFYMQNKEFLVSKSVITFTDTDGTLMALKPDVTLSIVKNYRPSELGVQKVCYSENIYRIAGAGKTYREIMQTGLECLGKIGAYELSEVLLLAVKSLSLISDNYILDISHLGVLSELLDHTALTEEQKSKVLACMGSKNESVLHQMVDIPKDLADKLQQLMQLNGPLVEISQKLPAFIPPEIAIQLKELGVLFEALGYGNRVYLDFSIVSDQNYYNGIAFRGYVEGLPTEVLTGGQYDRLMEKMEKKAAGVGFAVYLDQIELLVERTKDYGADIILLYDEQENLLNVHKMKKRFKDSRVMVLQTRPEYTGNCKVFHIKNGSVIEIE